MGVLSVSVGGVACVVFDYTSTLLRCNLGNALSGTQPMAVLYAGRGYAIGTPDGAVANGFLADATFSDRTVPATVILVSSRVYACCRGSDTIVLDVSATPLFVHADVPLLCFSLATIPPARRVGGITIAWLSGRR